MRFIWNFFFFGILFYLIWQFFPEAFNTLVSWANHVVTFFKELILNTWERVQHSTAPAPSPTPTTPSTLALLLSYFMHF